MLAQPLPPARVNNPHQASKLPKGRREPCRTACLANCGRSPFALLHNKSSWEGRGACRSSQKIQCSLQKAQLRKKSPPEHLTQGSPVAEISSAICRCELRFDFCSFCLCLVFFKRFHIVEMASACSAVCSFALMQWHLIT